jgi:hypothetical protein
MHQPVPQHVPSMSASTMHQICTNNLSKQLVINLSNLITYTLNVETEYVTEKHVTVYSSTNLI